ncbi:MAG: alpha/beta hydrolase [Chloroflexota bacterium]
MQTVRSKDGTSIAYEVAGTGAPLILVVGAFNDRNTGKPLTELLGQHFTVFNYDRRGKGDSGDTLPYAVEREIEDLDAMIAQAGGSALVFGYSSGAVLALRAAANGSNIPKLALYEPPPVGPEAGHMAAELARLVAENRRGDAVARFQKGVGIPEAMTAQFRNMPFWPGLEKVAHTLVYEETILSEALPVTPVPTLVMDGENSPTILHQSAQAMVDVLPHAQRRTLAGQTHDIVPAVVAPVVMEFFTSNTLMK